MIKKTVFLGIANTILFFLLGLALLDPVAKVEQIGDMSFSGTLTIYPIILIGYLIFYPIAFSVFKRVTGISSRDSSELSFSDEREKVIVSEAAKTGYVVLTVGLIVGIGIIAWVNFFSLFTQTSISIYKISIILMIGLLIVSMLSYTIRWIIEYKK